MARSADTYNSRGKAHVITSTLGLRSQTLIRASRHLRASDADRLARPAAKDDPLPVPKAKDK
jgi:hypothetical protein